MFSPTGRTGCWSQINKPHYLPASSPVSRTCNVLGRIGLEKPPGLLVGESSPQEGTMQYHTGWGPQPPASGPCPAPHILYNLGQRGQQFNCVLLSWGPVCNTSGVTEKEGEHPQICVNPWEFSIFWRIPNASSSSSVRNSRRSKQKEPWLGAGLNICLLLLLPSPLSDPILAQEKYLCSLVPAGDKPCTL